MTVTGAAGRPARPRPPDTRAGLPRAGRGQAVGLLGGSFDPAHDGHAHATREALRRFGLDRVWWLVSPGNPLKAHGPAPLALRMARARAVMRHPRVEVTDVEARLGTRHTAQTLAALGRLYPGVRFVWLMGADNLAQLHRWEDWRRIVEGVPVGVLVVALLVPALGLGLYATVGRPGVPSQPFAERGGERAAEAEIASLTAELRRRLEADPEGGPTEGWVLLGQTHMRRGDYGEAVAAFAVATAREDAPAGALTLHAEALVGGEGGVVTPPALALIDRALALDPQVPAAHYYRAQARAQAGDPAGGRRILLDRLAQAQGPEPWTEIFVAEVNRLGAEAGLAPVAARDVVPGLAEAEDRTPEEQDAAIRSMVDALAARLEAEPGDLEGWLRLGQARAVLGEAEAAGAAYDRALALMPRDDPRRGEVEAAAAALAP